MLVLVRRLGPAFVTIGTALNRSPLPLTDSITVSQGHPRSNVPTWYFGPAVASIAEQLARPEGIFHVLCGE